MYRNWLVGGGIFILWGVGSFFLSQYVEQWVLQDTQNGLVLQAKTVVVGLSASDIKQLTGSDDDIAKPEYQKLRKQFAEIRALSPDIRFVYLMGQRDDRQFFYADSEEPTSKDYSYPGQAYDDATVNDKLAYKEGRAYSKDLYTDAWGQWHSGYAPVRDADGQTVGMVGIDIAADKIATKLTIARIVTYIVTAFGTLLCVGIFTLINKHRR